MLNDRSTPLSLLATRRSGKARDMVGPGPTAGQLERLLTVASRVPDHGKLSPWRFVVVENRPAFADLLQAGFAVESPAAGEAEIATVRDFGGGAPCLVVVMSRVVAPAPIPVFEQTLSAGAACAMLCAAASAMGFVANWLTGWASRSAHVTAVLGEPGERIAGFVFIGTAAGALEDRPRPALATVVRHWDG